MRCARNQPAPNRQMPTVCRRIRSTLPSSICLICPTSADGGHGRHIASADYKVTYLLPPEGDDYQYRIKSAAEPHERVLKESQLQRESI